MRETENQETNAETSSPSTTQKGGAQVIQELLEQQEARVMRNAQDDLWIGTNQEMNMHYI